jgi:hypothetical protein
MPAGQALAAERVTNVRGHPMENSATDAVLAARPAAVTTASTPITAKRQTELPRLMGVLAAGWLLTWMASDVPILPINLFLKNHLHFGAGSIALFGLVSSIAWYFKPLAGIFSDSTPLFGTRRRHYLLGSALLGGVCWLLLGVVPRTYHSLLWTVTAADTMLMISSTVLGGLLVDAGKRHRVGGRLNAQREAVHNTVGLVAGPLGGFPASRAFGLTTGLAAGFLLALVPITFFFLREDPDARRSITAWRAAGQQLRTFLRSRTLWSAAGFICLVHIAPGFGTPLLFYQENTLRFSEQLIGNLGMVTGASGLAAAALYGALCRRFALRGLLTAGITLNVIGTLCYLAYRSPLSAALITGVAGLGFVLSILPLMDMAVRATPRGSEALGFALMMSVLNLTMDLSNMVGSWFYETYHWTIMQLVWLNAGTSALVLIAVPFLPGMLMNRRDGE